MEITPQDVQGRAQASKLAETNVRLASDVAYKIRHPWYRCQALTAVAEAETDRKRMLKLLEDAFNAAMEQSEINRVVTVSSWPLSPFAKIAPERAESKLRDLVSMAQEEPHTLRRSDALHMLLRAVADLPTLRKLVLPPLVDAAAQSRGWRIERIIEGVAAHVKRDFPDQLPRLLMAHRDNQKKRKLVDRLDSGSAA